MLVTQVIGSSLNVVVFLLPEAKYKSSKTDGLTLRFYFTVTGRGNALPTNHARASVLPNFRESIFRSWSVLLQVIVEMGLDPIFVPLDDPATSF